jgi:hypothetical protein
MVLLASDSFLFDLKNIFMNKMVSKKQAAAIETFERERNKIKEQPLYVLHAFASQHKIRGRSTRVRTLLEHLVQSYLDSFPKAKIACYQKNPQQVDCRKHTSIPTRDGELLRYKILKEQGEKVCSHKKYWICNLPQLA